jgi:hypothetical protein
MTSAPRTPQHHYAEAERLAEVAVSPGIEPGIQQTAALTAISHALLAAAPRRARRAPARHAGGNGLPSHLTWGDEQ